MSDITAGNLRLISQELLDALEGTFRPPIIEPDTPEATIKWEAAQHEVVQWIKAKAAGHQTTGRADPDPTKPTATGAFVRLGQ